MAVATARWAVGMRSRQRPRWVSAPGERRARIRQWIKILMMVLLLIVGTIPVAFARGGAGGFHGGFYGGGCRDGGLHDGCHDVFDGCRAGHWGHCDDRHLHGGI